uniref:Uncharacterized protein n=1 Tax=Arundo donax TaxID=35708 RepID=A0A0A9FJN4_ARUDO
MITWTKITCEISAYKNCPSINCIS